MPVHENIQASMARADELLTELGQEYATSLRTKQVRPRAIQLTHEVCERLRSVLDRLARRYWAIHIAPSLELADRKAAQIYFPICDDLRQFDSLLGRWRWKSVKGSHQDISAFLLNLQKFTNPTNHWLSVLHEITVQGKHIDLIPQSRQEQGRITVSSAKASVSWDPNLVSFGPGVTVAGAFLDPRTQRIIPTLGVEEIVQIWTSFRIQGYDLDALEFCASACVRVKEIAATMSDKFKL